MCQRLKLRGWDMISNSLKSTEMEFASFNDLISEIKLAFQVPSGKVNFCG